MTSLEMAAKKAMVEAWIQRTIAGDVELGRTVQNFAGNAVGALKRSAKGLNARGVRVYEGSGNVFLADLTGPAPVVLHRRPLAQRKVMLETLERGRA